MRDEPAVDINWRSDHSSDTGMGVGPYRQWDDGHGS